MKLKIVLISLLLVSVLTAGFYAGPAAALQTTATWWSSPPPPAAPVETTTTYLPYVSRPGPQLNFSYEIEINQGLGLQSGGQFKYVAGKDTVIRALVSQAITVEPGRTQAVIQRDGAVVATLAPRSYDSPTSVVEFLCPDRATCGDWAAGAYVFALRVNGLDKSTQGAQYQFLPRRSLRVLAVPVKANYGGTIKSVVGDAWKNTQFMRQVYPIAADGLNWELGQEVDASAYDIQTDAGQKALWEALTALQPTGCSPSGTPCYDSLVGFIKEAICQGTGCTRGYTYGLPATIVAVEIGAMAKTVAHEIGHTFDLGDEYGYGGGAFRCNINPPPPTADFVGRNFDLARTDPNYASAGYTCPQSTETNWPGRPGRGDPTNSGILINGSTWHPYDFSGRGWMAGDMTGFMGGGDYANDDQYWVSPREYDWLFDALALPAAVQSPSAPQRLVHATGWIARPPTNTVSLEPWYSFTGTVTITHTGRYAIQAVDGVGGELAIQRFDLSFIALTNPVSDLVEEYFDEVVPFPVGTKGFNVLSGTQVLTSLPVSLNPPTVTVTAPGGGEMISGTYTVTWNAGDLDGDPLYYQVEYSRDGTNWIDLANDVQEKEWVDDLSAFPGGSAARFRVTATDGVNAASADSGLFQVPLKAPEVFLYEPLANSAFDSGDEVVLDGEAYDQQDEWLSDSRLTWRSDRQGILGHGGLLALDNLQSGTHVISLEAANSLGLTATISTSIVIGPGLAPEWLEKTGRPGDVLQYTLRLTNTASLPDNFSLSAAGGVWPVNILTPSPLALGAGAAADIDIHVTIPLTETLPGRNAVVILAASQVFTNTMSDDPLTAASTLVSNAR